MRLFHAVNNADIIRMFFETTGKKLNVLLSYPFISGNAYKIVKLFRAMVLLVYLDSGAFSIHTGKSRHTLTEWISYVKEYGSLFDGVFNLDEFFDSPEGNALNQIRAEQELKGTPIKIIPVVHDKRDPFEEIKTYVESGADYVAVGSGKKLSDTVFSRIKTEYPDLKLHMFGTFDRKMLLKHKPYSADTASFIHQGRFGMIYFWDEVDCREYTIRISKTGKTTDDQKACSFEDFKHKDRLEEFLSSKLHYKYEDLLVSEDKKRIVNLYFYTQLEAYINEHL